MTRKHPPLQDSGFSQEYSLLPPGSAPEAARLKLALPHYGDLYTPVRSAMSQEVKHTRRALAPSIFRADEFGR